MVDVQDGSVFILAQLGSKSSAYRVWWAHPGGNSSSAFCLLSFAVETVRKHGNGATGEAAFAVVAGIAELCLY